MLNSLIDYLKNINFIKKIILINSNILQNRAFILRFGQDSDQNNIEFNLAKINLF